MTPAARKTDPETSHQAAEQVTRLRASQALVLNVFVAYGDMNDKDLLDRVHATQRGLGLPKVMSPSGVRSRRNELAKPNQDRIEELVTEWFTARDFIHGDVGQKWFLNIAPDFREATSEEIRAAAVSARAVLQMEGFRSKLWDTGKRELVDGRHVIVWGLAR